MHIRMDSILWGFVPRQMARPFSACICIAGCYFAFPRTLSFPEGRDNCQLPRNPKKVKQKK